MQKTVNEIAQMLGGRLVGDGVGLVTGLNGIREAGERDLTFVIDPRYFQYLDITKAAAILVPEGYSNGTARPVIEVKNPYQSFATLLRAFEEETLVHPTGIHPLAVVGENAVLAQNVAVGAHAVVEADSQLGEGVVIYPGVYVGRGSVIGPGTVIYPNAVIRERSKIGARCIIHSNVSIGSDGFGFSLLDGKHAKIPQVGRVVIGDDVEIGSNTAIDRATCGATVVGSGTKIDNLVQVGHNVQIGEHCTISGSTGISGSARIGNRVTIGGQAGIGGHVEIGDDAIIAGRSGVTKSVAPGKIVSGFPAHDHEANKRLMVSQRHLPAMQRRLRALEREFDKLRREIDGQATDDT